MNNYHRRAFSFHLSRWSIADQHGDDIDSMKGKLLLETHKCLGLPESRTKFSDLTVVIETHKFRCHRFVLNACSGFFKDRLRSIGYDDEHARVTLSDVQPDIFKSVLDLLYCGSDILNEGNMLDVWSASQHLDISFLEQMCEDYVYVNVANVFKVYCQAKQCRCERITECTLDYAVEHYEPVVSSDKFHRIHYQDFAYILTSEHLSVSVKFQVESILKWCGADDFAEHRNGDGDEINNIEHLGDLLELVDLSKVEECFLKRLMVNDRVLGDKRAISTVNKHMLLLMNSPKRSLNFFERWSVKLGLVFYSSARIRSRTVLDRDRVLYHSYSSARRFEGEHVFMPRYRGIVHYKVAKVQILQHIHDRFSRHHNRAMFCDVKVCVEGVEFHCHRFVLNACSGFFQTLFESEDTKSEFEVEGISQSTFSLILEMIYTCSGVLNTQNMYDVLQAACKLKINFLTALCEKFILSKLSHDNCNLLYYFSNLLKLNKMYNSVLNFMAETFQSLVDSQNFTEIPFDAIVSCLKHVKLSVSVDNQIKAILKWCGAEVKVSRLLDRENQNLQYLGKLINTVDLTKATVVCLHDLMINPHIQDSQEAVEAVNLQASNLIQKKISVEKNRTNVSGVDTKSLAPDFDFDS